MSKHFDNPTPTKPLLSHAKAAEVLGISLGALYQMVYRGQIGVYKNGRKSFYTMEDIIEYQTKIYIPAYN